MSKKAKIIAHPNAVVVRSHNKRISVFHSETNDLAHVRLTNLQPEDKRSSINEWHPLTILKNKVSVLDIVLSPEGVDNLIKALCYHKARKDLNVKYLPGNMRIKVESYSPKKTQTDEEE